MLVRGREIPLPLPRSSFSLECVNMTTPWTINVKKITGQILKVNAINGAVSSVLYNFTAFVKRVRPRRTRCHGYWDLVLIIEPVSIRVVVSLSQTASFYCHWSLKCEWLAVLWSWSICISTLICLQPEAAQENLPQNLLSLFYFIYAPINVMPHYPRYGLRWGKVGICIPENLQFPTNWGSIGDAYPDKSPNSETRGKWG